jgi:shikimate dehydrogenase
VRVLADAQDSAMTKCLYFIIGDPVEQARSPEVFNARFLESRLDAEMLPLEVSSSGFADVVAALSEIRNFDGAVVTIPHKPAAAKLALTRSKRVEIAGAANVMRWMGQGWDADLFDGEGFLGGLKRRRWSAAGQRVAVVGAGGAGLAISAALLDAGVAKLSLDDIDERRADQSVTRLHVHYHERVARGRPDAGHDLVVNATPMGMAPEDPSPIDLDAISASALVAEVIMKPPKTRLLLEAERRGFKTQPGAPMLDEQADMIWSFFGLHKGARAQRTESHAGAQPVEPRLDAVSAGKGAAT